MIQLQKIEKSYKLGENYVKALSGISLHIAAKEYLAITGTSGSGKSTLLNILGLLDTPTGGDYFLNGMLTTKMDENHLSELRSLAIGFIFQNFNLLPKATALQNVMQPLIYQKVRAKDRTEKARAALSQLGMTDREHHYPNQLSGGQRQRVAIARAIVTNPKLIIADEPTGNLDSDTTEEVMSIFDQLSSAGHTIVLVTHEIDVAKRSRRILKMSDGLIISDSKVCH